MKPGDSTEQRVHIEGFRRRHCTGLLTLVFTDMVDATGLQQRLDLGFPVQQPSSQ